MSLVSTNLRRGTRFLCSSKSKLWSTRLITATDSISYTSKRVRGLMSLTLTNSVITRFDFVSQTGPPEIQFPGGSASEEELPSRPSKGPEWIPLEVPELPNTPEINPSETPPEVTTVPNDPPPLGPPDNPSPEFPVPPSPSPPMPETPNTPTPETPPSPEIPPPGIDPPPPMGQTIV